jgi:hypothetical protein
MYSGGVDSAAALLTLTGPAPQGGAPAAASRPGLDWLIHLSNFDCLDEDTSEARRSEALASTTRIAHDRGIGWMHLRTNIADVLKHSALDGHFPGSCSFWLGLQHVHHMSVAASVVRPLLSTIYVAGGFNDIVTSYGSCAASSAFVNLYSYPAAFSLIHEYEPRVWKTAQLIDFAPELLQSLRICFSSGGAATCTACRKCQTTALMLLAAGGSLRGTTFPPGLEDALIERILEIRHLPVSDYAYFNQALDGRALHGDRQERWNQLIQLVESGRRAAPVLLGL